GLIEHHPYRGVRLTPEGRKVALEVIRHHRLLELFLAEALEMPWDRVHDEAEVLEHVISEDLERLIAAKLGDPTFDPHGDPIPSAALELHEPETLPLERLAEGDGGVFVRVSDADPEMLRYLSERGISPGDRLHVRERQPFGAPLLVSFAGGQSEHAIGGRLARAMRVQLDPDATKRESAARRERIASELAERGARPDGADRREVSAARPSGLRGCSRARAPRLRSPLAPAISRPCSPGASCAPR